MENTSPYNALPQENTTVAPMYYPSMQPEPYSTPYQHPMVTGYTPPSYPTLPSTPTQTVTNHATETAPSVITQTQQIDEKIKWTSSR